MSEILVTPNARIVIPAGIDINDPRLFTADTHTYRSPNYLTPAQLPVTRSEQTVAVAVKHKTEGRIAGDMSRLLSKNAKVSCHAYIPRDIGPGNMRYFQVVDDINEAWQCGVSDKDDQKDGAFRKYLGWTNENYQSIGDEIEGRELEQFTQWQMICCVWRQRQLSKRFPKMLLDRAHIIGHYEITVQKSDPQLFPWEGFMDAVKNAGAMPADPPLLIPGAEFPIVQPAFKAFFKAEMDALRYWGLPISDAHMQVLSDGKSYVVQYFQRARFELHLESGTPQVLLGLVGAELLLAVHSPISL